MKIAHFSDWHTDKFTLPVDADLYVCTGDMMPNFPKIIVRVPGKNPFEDSLTVWDPYDPATSQRPQGSIMVGRKILPAREAEMQLEWQKKFPLVTSGPTICVRGNHDFCDIGQWMGAVWEVKRDPVETFEFGGLKFGGVRGIPYIVGEWADELRDEQFNEICENIPLDLDVLITHSPPWGVLDQFSDEHSGARALARYINRRQYTEKKLKAHLFGHIHESSSTRELGGTVFSNAARCVNLVDIS